MAEETWWPTYSPILTFEQIRYMLDAIYSAEALQRTMENGSQTFIILHDERGPQGFASYGPKPGSADVIKLHKIYVLPDNHGKGYGKLLIDEVKKRTLALKINTLDLNVNRYNKAKSFYEKIGFQVIGEEDVPIGPYWMNDYIMRLQLEV
ncbi:GNAT family N-acetyltransferase [Fulvivirgaceae bacterium PWU4]|uniref:GNAT family N-acetyltransferase n=2 Tax=Chryseosolibacter histidini TaxID=2782349 RepID=A0AAP2DKZ2_9BACT|nr:GNAT family N-acetyltransferase [Chryseosolibacter histidini]MBT1698265.1 GNAT family N-acetyltransferase [Chryseosolibacter histidini]